MQVAQMWQFLTIQTDNTVKQQCLRPMYCDVWSNLVEEQNLLLVDLTPSMPSLLWCFVKWTSLVEGLVS